MQHAVHARTSAVAYHGYHAHPSDGTSPGSRATQDGAIRDGGSYFRSRAVARFTDRPFFITEYGTPYWHRYRHEEGLLIPSYSGLQNLAGITVHAQAVVSKLTLPMYDFSVGRDPINRANQVLAALLYARGDVSPSKHLVELTAGDEWVFQGGNALKSIDSGISRLALLSGIGLHYEGRPVPSGIPVSPRADMSIKSFGGSEVIATEMTAAATENTKSDTATRLIAEMRRRGILSAENKTDHALGNYQSDTGEIFMESALERLSVATPKTCGVAIKSGVSGNAGALLSASSDVPASIAVSSLDDLPLNESKKILLVYATDAVNTGHETSEDRVVLRKIGELPILLETGKFSAAMSCKNTSTFRCYALRLDGLRKEEITVTSKDNVLSISIDTAKLKNGPALFFELEAK
jgi:hypothetical protein